MDLSTNSFEKPLNQQENLLTDPEHQWYRDLTVAQASINKLQIYKETTSTVLLNRFVMIYMKDGSTYHLERPENKQPCLHKVDDMVANEVVQRTKPEIELLLDGKFDLSVLLSTCFAISNDPLAKDSSQSTYNSFFFTWTILMVAARNCMPYEVPSAETLRTRALEHYPRLTNYIVKQATDLFLALVVETVAVFRNKAGAVLYRGLDPFTRATWALPNNVLRFICRRAYRARLHFGLRKQLEKQVAEVLKIKALEILDQALKHHPDPNAVLNGHMWLKDLDKAVEPVLRAEIVKVLWGALFDAICGGYGDGVDQAVTANLKYTLILGQRLPQFYAMWNAALHGGLCAARVQTDLEEEKDTEGADVPAALDAYDAYVEKLNKKMFRLAWEAASDGALKEAEKVVNMTQKKMKPQPLRMKRQKMWDEVWRIWPEVWTETLGMTEQRAVDYVNKILREVLNTTVKVFDEEMRGSDTRFIGAHTERKVDKRKRSKPVPKEHMTNATLQQLMHDIMKREKLSAEQVVLVDEAISRIWTEAGRLPPLTRTEEVHERM
ncbi:hypothetical protein WG66_017040 [Moniliophthora roreri]|nr:hypothetical protein WG66_017040 [Moniliophthora roreri]